MLRYLLATLVLIAQEVVSLNTLLFETKQGHYIPWIIHAIFLVATAFDIWIGYAVGTWVKRRHKTGKLVRFADKCAARFHAYVGKRGRKFALFLLGNFSFPYVNSFIAAWLDIPFWESFMWLFVGNVIFYFASWFFIIGVMAVVPNPGWGLAAVIGITALVVIVFRRFRK